MFNGSHLNHKRTLLGVLRKAGQEVRIEAPIDLRLLEPMLTDWAKTRPGQHARLVQLLTTANEHILGGRYDAAVSAFREAIRIVDPYSSSKAHSHSVRAGPFGTETL